MNRSVVRRHLAWMALMTVGMTACSAEPDGGAQTATGGAGSTGVGNGGVSAGRRTSPPQCAPVSAAVDGGSVYARRKRAACRLDGGALCASIPSDLVDSQSKALNAVTRSTS
ncbi:hypothetical protein EDD94_7071 [Streptomyces sp. PanSC9]|nr:hypothetical protein EDD94_7071 [Streptomyces sp. PanSC9]